MTAGEAELLQHAVKLAFDNVVIGQRPFGAIVVRDGTIIAAGVNAVLKDGDPTAHAEVAAIRAACRVDDSVDLAGAVVYTSCEPCVMCQAVGVTAGVSRMIFAASSELAATLGFPAAELATRMQDSWRASEPTYTQAGPDLGELSEAPFRHWIDTFGEGIRA